MRDACIWICGSFSLFWRELSTCPFISEMQTHPHVNNCDSDMWIELPPKQIWSMTSGQAYKIIFQTYHMWISLRMWSCPVKNDMCGEFPPKKKKTQICMHASRILGFLYLGQLKIQGNVRPPLKYCFPAHRSSVPPYIFNQS